MYRAHEFAQLAGTTVKALHHYDRLGLLKPRRSPAGYRMYVEQDLTRLEQIVALKFLGLPLKQIKLLFDHDSLELPEALRMQRRVLEEKRRLLDGAIGAIARAEEILKRGIAPRAALLKGIIEAIGRHTDMQNDLEFMKNYYREEAWLAFKSRHRDWPSRAWNDLFREIASSMNDDPATEDAQRLAARWRALRVADSGGDPQLHGGLIKAWADRQYWPEAIQQQFAAFNLGEISRFIARAFGCYRQKHFGELAWSAELATFTPEEKARFPLAMTDLHFKIEAALEEDPAASTGQALAARWMEIVESRTGNNPNLSPGEYELVLRWMDGWPSAIFQRFRTMDHTKLLEFILKAAAIPMLP